jgi:hypothetical protein
MLLIRRIGDAPAPLPTPIVPPSQRTKPKVAVGVEHRGVVPFSADRLWNASRISDNGSDETGSKEAWKYAFPATQNYGLSELRIRLTGLEDMPTPKGRPWDGSFEIAAGRHVDVLPWPAARAIVVAAANAVYIVNPDMPQRFSGFAAPIEISGFTFDESQQRLFIADSLRIYSFSADGLFRWISEPLDGYGARFRGCQRGVLAVEVRRPEPSADSEEGTPCVVRLCTEDGAVLR